MQSDLEDQTFPLTSPQFQMAPPSAARRHSLPPLTLQSPSSLKTPRPTHEQSQTTLLGSKSLKGTQMKAL